MEDLENEYKYILESIVIENIVEKSIYDDIFKLKKVEPNVLRLFEFYFVYVRY